MKGKRNHVKKSAPERTTPYDAPGRSLQKSRKGTKAWRKNIDLEDVTGGLERVREQKIQGGILSERPNDELFRVDTHGDKSVVKRERLGKTLRTDEILALKSAIQPVSGLAHKNSSLLGTGIVHKKKKGPLPPSELLRLKKITNRVKNSTSGSTAAASQKTQTAKEYDVWDAPSSMAPTMSEWVDPVRSKRPPVTYGQAPLNLATDGGSVPAVEIAEAGQSYNPPIEEWNELIARKAEEQTKLDEAQRRQNVKNRAAQAVDERLEFDSTAKDIMSEPESEEETPAVSSSNNPANARATAKTQTQRNKEARKLRQLELEASIRARKAERKAIATLGSLIDSKTDLTQTEKDSLVTEIKRNSSATTTTAATLRRHKFGRHQIPLDPLEIQLSHELAESFRTLKPEGNLFKDRFMSLVKRGIVEARIPQSKRRRYALLHKEKYGHKFEAGRPFMA